MTKICIFQRFKNRYIFIFLSLINSYLFTMDDAQTYAFIQACTPDAQDVYTALADRSKSIRLAISAGAPINGGHLPDNTLISPLYVAAHAKDPQLFEWLIAHGASTEAFKTHPEQYRSVLHALFYIKEIDPRMEARKLKAAMKSFMKDSLSQEYIIMQLFNGELPLHNAAYVGDEHRLDRSLAYGLDPDRQDGQGRTALMIACAERRYGCIKILLAYGANAHITDKNACTVEDYIPKQFDQKVATMIRKSVPFRHTKIPLQYSASAQDEQRAQEIHAENETKLAALKTQQNASTQPPVLNLSDVEIPSALRIKLRVPKKMITYQNTAHDITHKPSSDDSKDGDYVPEEFLKKKKGKKRKKAKEHNSTVPLPDEQPKKPKSDELTISAGPLLQ